MLTIMPMGDSITHGFNVPGGYRKPLDELSTTLTSLINGVIAEEALLLS